jgi:hypothetical protein
MVRRASDHGIVRPARRPPHGGGTRNCERSLDGDQIEWLRIRLEIAELKQLASGREEDDREAQHR